MKRKLIVVILIASLLVCLVPAVAVKADPGWSYYSPITIQASQVEATLTNFPVLISVNNTRMKHTESGGNVGKTNGGDILFTNDANTVKYDHEIEKYDSSAGTLVAWVRIPSLSGSANTTIWMWYGNSTCDDQWSPTGVWDDNYKMVQHMDDDPDTSHIDDSIGVSDGTKKGAAEPAEADAKIGKGQNCDGNDDYISINLASSLTTYTLTAWVKVNSYQEYMIGLGGYDSSLSTHYFEFFKSDSSYCSGNISFNPEETAVSICSPIHDANWHLYTLTRSGNTVSLYVEGTFINSSSAGNWSGRGLGKNIKIGSSRDATNFFNGTIDEVRISSTARSTEWIKTSYNNHNNPSSFHTLGDEVYPVPEQPVPELPTIILIGIGLIAITGYFVLKKRRSTM